MARDVRKLEVFCAADALLFEAMAIATTLDVREHRAICDQRRRAARSVPLNLVEGAQRTTTKEFGRFVEIATGSAAEGAVSVVRGFTPAA